MDIECLSFRELLGCACGDRCGSEEDKGEKENGEGKGKGKGMGKEGVRNVKSRC